MLKKLIAGSIVCGGLGLALAGILRLDVPATAQLSSTVPERALPPAPGELPDQSVDWAQSLIDAANKLGAAHTDTCIKRLREHIAANGFYRGAAFADGRFFVRDIYGRDTWLC